MLVSAIVTYTVGDGFYLQEEDADADGDSATSEGIFVYTGGTPSIRLGDKVEVAGTVAEHFDLTEITDITDIITLSSGNARPTSASIALSPDFEANLEQYEGMAIKLTSGTDDPLTVIENFDLGRFGEITVSAGSQVQPTHLFHNGSRIRDRRGSDGMKLSGKVAIVTGPHPASARRSPCAFGRKAQW